MTLYKNKNYAQKYTFIIGKNPEEQRWEEFKFKGKCEDISVPCIYDQCGRLNKLDWKEGVGSIPFQN